MRHALVLSAVLALCTLQGCTVLAIADVVGTAAVKTAGAAASVATDVAVGTIKLTGKAVGAVADAVTPDAEPKK